VVFGDFDLLQDETEVRGIQVETRPNGRDHLSGGLGHWLLGLAAVRRTHPTANTALNTALAQNPELNVCAHDRRFRLTTVQLLHGIPPPPDRRRQ
jgi:hypothetical protein